jgi:hypothetical protein
MTSFQNLRTDVSHRVATIWLNRPADAAPADAAEGVTAFPEKRAPQWPLSKVKDYPPMLSE